MKQLENNIDAYFKSKLDPVIMKLDKDKAWKKLERKRTGNKIGYYFIAVAASVLIGLILVIVDIPHKENENILSDFEKRQKLKEYEMVISGTYVETLLCYNCSGSIMESQIKQVPENKWIIEVY